MEDVIIFVGFFVGLIFCLVVLISQTKASQKASEDRQESPISSHDLNEEFSEGFNYEVQSENESYKSTNLYMVLLKGSEMNSSEIIPLYLKDSCGNILDEVGWFVEGAYIEGNLYDSIVSDINLDEKAVAKRDKKAA
jgi:hypothetical protein